MKKIFYILVAMLTFLAASSQTPCYGPEFEYAYGNPPVSPDMFCHDSNYHNGSIGLTLCCTVPPGSPFTLKWSGKGVKGSTSPYLENLSEGNYTVTVTTTCPNNEVNLETFSFYVPLWRLSKFPKPEISVAGSCDSMQLWTGVVADETQYTYQWSYKNSIINSAEITAYQSGTYRLSVTYRGILECTRSADTTIRIIQCDQVDGKTENEVQTDQFSDTRFSVYPNPFAGTFHISGTQGHASIFDVTKRLVESVELDGSDQEITVNGPGGLYIIKVGTTTLKLIKI